MRRSLSILGLSALLAATGSDAATGQDISLPPAWSVIPQRVLTARTYTEGPVFGSDEASGISLYASQTATGEVVRYGADGTETVWLSGFPGANGHARLADGTHVVMSRPSIVFADPNGEVLHTISEYEGASFVFPNDLTLDGVGGFWFTDSGSRTESTCET